MKIWRVLRGVVGDKTFKLIRERPTEVNNGRVVGCFYAGDVIGSDKDLSRHNLGNCGRFERLPDEVVDEETVISDETFDDDLADLTIPQLKSRAEEMEVELDGINKKQDIVDFLRLAMKRV